MQRALSYIGMALASGLLALGVHDRFTPKGDRFASLSTTPTAPVRMVSLPNGSGGTTLAADFTGAAERTVNAVVHVTTEATVQQQRDPLAEFFWGYREQPSQQVKGAGSGVIISDDGYIVTNNHVVEGADKIQVHLNDKRAYEAKVIGRDPSTDIALIKIDGKGLPTLGFGNSDDVRVGEWVLAVGNPMNLTSTVTAGIVSAKARNINILQYDPGKDIFPIESFIQTDAAVNPGNSGGALVNANGDLVGINSAIASTTGAYTGYSFAIPVNIVRKVTSDLMEFGSVQRAYLGVSISDIDQDMAKQYDLDRLKGVYVKGVTEGGAAEKAGLKTGDVIVKVGSINVDNVPELQEQVGKFRPGDHVAVTFLRGTKEQVVDMTLRGKEGNVKLVSEKETTVNTVLGAQLAPASSDELKALKLGNGVKVIGLDAGKLRSTGIREGFIITRIDQTPVQDAKDIARALENKRGGVLIEGVYPNGTRAYYGLGI
ncbi:MAG: Do family serine endopeptidase [Flavobacteriales bacterium]